MATIRQGDDDDDDGGPEGDQVVLHEGEDLGVQLRVAGEHLQRLIDKPAKWQNDYLTNSSHREKNILIFPLSDARLRWLRVLCRGWVVKAQCEGGLAKAESEGVGGEGWGGGEGVGGRLGHNGEHCRG